MKLCKGLLMASVAFLSVVVGPVAHAVAFPAPEEDMMTIVELSDQRARLDGKVIETEVMGAGFIKQVAAGKYQVECQYRMGRHVGGNRGVLFPEEGRSFFRELAKKHVDVGETTEIFIFVRSKTPIKIGERSYIFEVLGTDYCESTGEYNWGDYPLEEVPVFSEGELISFENLLFNTSTLEGQTIRTEVTHAGGYKKISEHEYSAICHYAQDGVSVASDTIYFPKKGKSFSQKLDKKEWGSEPWELYVKVGEGGRLEAVGKRRRNKAYRW